MQNLACHSRQEIPGETRLSRCAHPRVHCRDQVVSPEICSLCNYQHEAAPAQFRELPPLGSRLWRPTTVAVVIPCHNYGRFLREAIESVLRQTHQPNEILVVDDSSNDDTRLITEQFTADGVRYLRVEFRHSQAARLAGFRATESDVLCFLDADDQLSKDYLHEGLAQINDIRIGLVYSDVEYFGRRRGRTEYPATVDRGTLLQMNYLHTGCLVLREALQISRGLEIQTDDRLILQDWLLWRRLLADGWQAKKQSGLYCYRQHEHSMTAEWRPWASTPDEYYHRAGLSQETVTLAVPLSGRTRHWPRFANFLERQLWPHRQTRLVLLDTSQQPEFASTVRSWLATCDYSDMHYVSLNVGAPGLADQPRLTSAADVSLAMARIYNRLAREVTTDYTWIVEDDVYPPLNACEALLRGFDKDTISVSGAYASRFARGYVAWHRDQNHIRERGNGLQTISGNGFGCVVLRTGVLRDTVFTATLDLPAFDNAFYFRLQNTPWKVKIHWGIICDHVGAILDEKV